MGNLCCKSNNNDNVVDAKMNKNNDEKEEAKMDDTKKFEYEHDFDANGILFAIGTDFGNIDYKNPLGKVKFDWQDLMSNGDHDTGFVGRDDHGATVRTDGQKDVWYCLDFDKYRIKATRYTLRSCYDSGRQRALNWELQASNDKQNWICLKKHTKIKLEKGVSDNGYSSVHTWSVDNHNDNDFYQYFRVYIKNWKAHNITDIDKRDDELGQRK